MGGMVYGVDGLKIGGGGGGMGYGNCACAGLIVPPNRATNPATKNFPSVIRLNGQSGHADLLLRQAPVPPACRRRWGSCVFCSFRNA